MPQKFGTNAYMPLLKTDRCLQLLLKLLHTCLLRGSGTFVDGEDHVLSVFCQVYHWYSGQAIGTQNEKQFLTFFFSFTFSKHLLSWCWGGSDEGADCPSGADILVFAFIAHCWFHIDGIGLHLLLLALFVCFCRFSLDFQTIENDHYFIYFLSQDPFLIDTV